MRLRNRAARPKKTNQGRFWILIGYGYLYAQISLIAASLLTLIPVALGALHPGWLIFSLWTGLAGTLGLTFDVEAVRADRHLDDTLDVQDATPRHRPHHRETWPKRKLN